MVATKLKCLRSNPCEPSSCFPQVSERRPSPCSIDLCPSSAIRGLWTLDGNLYIDIDDEQTGQHGGAATDDQAAHPWTLPEILSEAVLDGPCFFGFRGYHELNRERGRS